MEIVMKEGNESVTMGKRRKGVGTEKRWKKGKEEEERMEGMNEERDVEAWKKGMSKGRKE